MKTILVACLALLCLPLAGCLTAQERQQQMTAQDDQKCRSFGATPGSDIYVKCRMNLNDNREANQRAAMDDLANSIHQQPYIVPPMAPPNPTITCLRTGNLTTCN
jgi:hypothetical protein